MAGKCASYDHADFQGSLVAVAGGKVKFCEWLGGVASPGNVSTKSFTV